jgi:DNA gyrase subunit A
VRPNTELQRQQALDALPGDGRLLIQADGVVRIVAPQALGRLHLDEAAPIGEHPAPARLILPVAERPSLLAFSASGRVAMLRWEFAAQQPGSLEKFLPESLLGDPIVEVLPLPQTPTGTLGLLSSDGRFKRLPLETFRELSGRAATVLKLKDGVQLRRVVPCTDGQDLVVASTTGRLLRLAVNDDTLPLMGKAAQGPTLLRLLPGESVVGAACVDPGTDVLLVSRHSQLKRLEVESLRRCERGDLREDELVDLQAGSTAIVGLRFSTGRSIRLAMADLQRSTGEEGPKEPLWPCSADETVIDLVPLLS